jgi:hypothetical protein
LTSVGAVAYSDAFVTIEYALLRAQLHEKQGERFIRKQRIANPLHHFGRTRAFSTVQQHENVKGRNAK